MNGAFGITLSEDDLVAAFRLNARLERTRPLWLAVLLLTFLLVLLLILSPQARWSATSRPLTLMLEGALALVVFLVAAVIVSMRPIWRLIARRSLAQRGDLAGLINYAFSPDGLTHRTVYSQSTYPWTALHGWRENDRMVMIYLSAHLFYPIPTAQVAPETLEALREALRTGGVPRR